MLILVMLVLGSVLGFFILKPFFAPEQHVDDPATAELKRLAAEQAVAPATPPVTAVNAEPTVTYTVATNTVTPPAN